MNTLHPEHLQSYCPMEHSPPTWTTDDEIQYLEQIGDSNYKGHPEIAMLRKELLQGYKTALDFRPRSDLDFDVIRERLRELMEEA